MNPLQPDEEIIVRPIVENGKTRTPKRGEWHMSESGSIMFRPIEYVRDEVYSDCIAVTVERRKRTEPSGADDEVERMAWELYSRQGKVTVDRAFHCVQEFIRKRNAWRASRGQS